MIVKEKMLWPELLADINKLHILILLGGGNFEMNKSESKYFNTAVKMDKAFLELLEKKDFEYITVKEICEKAGVNRSTFYLHYETIADLLDESLGQMIDEFLSFMKRDPKDFLKKLNDCSLEELYLVTPEYLIPYLHYVREHKRLFRTAIEKAAVLRLQESFSAMSIHIFEPILERFRVPENERKYMVLFHVKGLMAIVEEWLKNDCADSVKDIVGIMQNCVVKYPKNSGK